MLDAARVYAHRPRSVSPIQFTDWPRVTVARASELAPGTVKMFTYPGVNDPCILIRRVDGEFAAFSRQCTHLSCAVYYWAEENRLECPCHEGYFSAETGRVLQGPPPRPLPRVLLEQQGDDLIATAVELGGDHA